jgi:FHA domain
MRAPLLSPDYLHEALHSTREAFVAAHPYPFLVGVVALNPMKKARRTGTFDAGATLAGASRAAMAAERPTVLPVRKVQSTFESMITIGRTKNNDIVLLDAEVSKLHAYFREIHGAWELADGGSANGTRVADALLEPKGPARPVHPGDRVAFAHLEFRFLDAASCWDELQRAR